MDHWVNEVIYYKKFQEDCGQVYWNEWPAPAANNIPGITFDKLTPYDYYTNCDTLYGSLTSPGDCRWDDCQLPNKIWCSDDNGNIC